MMGGRGTVAGASALWCRIDGMLLEGGSAPGSPTPSPLQWSLYLFPESFVAYTDII